MYPESLSSMKSLMKLLSPTSLPSIPSSSQPLDILFEKPDQVSVKLTHHYEDPLPP